MTPTPRLRFVARIKGSQIVKVLQQWWVDTDAVFDTVTKDIRGEWRDVPLEEEK